MVKAVVRALQSTQALTHSLEFAVDGTWLHAAHADSWCALQALRPERPPFNDHGACKLRSIELPNFNKNDSCVCRVANDVVIVEGLSRDRDRRRAGITLPDLHILLHRVSHCTA